MLFLERVNDVTRLLVDPARDGHDEELQHVGKRRHTGRAEQRLSAVTNIATRRASSVESARRTALIGFLDSTASAGGSCPYGGVDSSEILGRAGDRVYQGEECDSRRSRVWRSAPQLRGAALLGAGLLRLDSRSG